MPVLRPPRLVMARPRAVLPGVEEAKDAGAVGLRFAELADGWADYAATLAEMYP